MSVGNGSAVGFGDWLGIIGVLLGIVALPAGVYLGRRNRQVPDLRYAIDHDEIIAPDDWLFTDGLSLRFQGENVARLCRTYVAIWNKRGDTVRGSDIVDSDLLRVVLDESDDVLSARVVAASRKQIEARVDRKAATITFDFLDQGDGFVVEVLHRVPSPPTLTGTIRGAHVMRQKGSANLQYAERQAMRKSWWTRYKSKRNPAARASDLVILVMGLICATLGFSTLARFQALAGLDHWFFATDHSQQSRPLIVGLLFLNVGAVVLALATSTRRAISSVVPASVVAEDSQLVFEPQEVDVSVVTYPGSDTVVRIGDRFTHKDFGSGTIVRLTGIAPKVIGYVDFDNHGAKKLMIRIAPIQPL